MRDGGLVRLRERALRHLDRARQSPPRAGGERGAGRYGRGGAGDLVPSADRASRRPQRQASRRGAVRVPASLTIDGFAAALARGVVVLLAGLVKGAIGFGLPTLGTP